MSASRAATPLLWLIALSLSIGAARTQDALGAPRAPTATSAATTATSAPAPAAAAPAAAPATAASAEAASAAQLAPFDLSRPDIRAYIAQASTQGLAAQRIIAALSAAEPQPQIIEAMSRPAEKTLQWWEYRARMLSAARIAAGARLWRAHKELLDQIATQYRVPPEYLIAVLGVETLYGRFMGHYRVIDALATLAFDYPPRANYFRHELTAFLLLSNEQDLDPLAIRGSYAGAMGALQFMPSSYRKYAISEPGAHSNLWDDWSDIFASTANFLHQAGWQDGAPVLAETRFATEKPPTVAEHMQLTETLASLRSKGLVIASNLPDDTPTMLLAAPEQDAMRYRVGFQNFYVITRYNGSPLYAMAVYELARAIRERVALEAAL